MHPAPALRQVLTLIRHPYRPRRLLDGRVFEAAPMIDLGLLLILFFWISNANYILQPCVTVDLPAAEFTDGLPYGPTIVAITPMDMIYFRSKRTPLADLPSAFAQAVHENPDTDLIIEADGSVRQHLLIKIINMAREAGIRRIGLATRVSSDGMEAP